MHVVLMVPPEAEVSKLFVLWMDLFLTQSKGQKDKRKRVMKGKLR